jgi:putative zinc finger/helix-turn-helix YgiT family protein
MQCPKCKIGNVKLQKGPYRYSESGLDHIVLKNIRWWECAVCQGSEVEIPRIGQLHRCIAWIVVTNPSLLTGPEIVFLRKQLCKNQKEMAETLGIKQVVLNRWETGARKSHSKANDILLRLSYLILQDDEYTNKIDGKQRAQLFTYFGSIKDRAAPSERRIDPNRCDPKEIIQNSFLNL